MFVAFLTSTIAIATVFLFGSVGEIITEKGGHLNLGIPGIMCMGAAGGCWGLSLYTTSIGIGATPNYFIVFFLTVFFAILFSCLGGIIYAFLTVTLKSNQNVTGLALTTFGSGFAQFFVDGYVDRSNFSASCKLISKGLPLADKLGWFGQIFLSHGILVYMAIAIAIVAAIILKRTRIGLNLRSVGEDPAAADAAGINVTKYKYAAILVGSAIAGLGGLFYIIDYIKGSWENASTIVGMGWLVVALVIFALWKPNVAILGSFVFGGLYIASSFISGISFSQMRLISMLPYVVTIIVLIITSIIDQKENQPPASLGLPYFREER